MTIQHKNTEKSQSDFPEIYFVSQVRGQAHASQKCDFINRCAKSLPLLTTLLLLLLDIREYTPTQNCYRRFDFLESRFHYLSRFIVSEGAGKTEEKQGACKVPQLCKC
jgi:hypothetical protein